MFGLIRSFFNYAQDTLGTIGRLPLTTKPLKNALILSTLNVLWQKSMAHCCLYKMYKMCAHFTRKVQNILNFHILAGFRLGLKIEFMNIIVKAINQVMLVN